MKKEEILQKLASGELKVEDATKGTVRQTITIKAGISSDQARAGNWPGPNGWSTSESNNLYNVLQVPPASWFGPGSTGTLHDILGFTGVGASSPQLNGVCFDVLP